MALTWRGGLDLSSLVLFVVCKNLRRRVFTTLNFALKGIQTLDVLFLQRAGSTAGCTHIQGSGQITPFLILIHLGDTTRHIYNTDSNRGPAINVLWNLLLLNMPY